MDLDIDEQPVLEKNGDDEEKEEKDASDEEEEEVETIDARRYSISKRRAIQVERDAVAATPLPSTPSSQLTRALRANYSPIMFDTIGGGQETLRPIDVPSPITQLVQVRDHLHKSHAPKTVGGMRLEVATKLEALDEMMFCLELEKRHATALERDLALFEQRRSKERRKDAMAAQQAEAPKSKKRTREAANGGHDAAEVTIVTKKPRREEEETEKKKK
jgi:hypothetical protein